MNDVIRCLLTRRSVKKYRAEQSPAPTICPARREKPSGFPQHLLLTAIVLRQLAANLILPYQAARTKTLVR